MDSPAPVDKVQVDIATPSIGYKRVVPLKRTHCGSSMFPGPPSVRNIIGNELCERFSFYGLRAILPLYLKYRLHYSTDDATAIFSYTASLAYFFPIVGGIISDSCLGKYKTIMYFSMIYVIGSCLLAASAVPDEASLITCFAGLFLISVGTGGIKPCVSSFGADQFSPEEKTELRSYFAVFYMSINIGSVGSFLITPILREKVGYDVAFALPAVLLAVATFLFWLARASYIRLDTKGSPLGDFVKVICSACCAGRSHRAGEEEARDEALLEGAPKGHWIDKASRQGYDRKQIKSARAVWKLLPVFCTLPLFWALFDQQGSAWTFQAETMDLMGLQPEQVGVINPLLIITLIPLFERYIYHFFKRFCCNPAPLIRTSVGMIIAASAFVASGFLQSYIDSQPPKSVNVLWQLPQILLISIAEILVSITAIEFAYSQAPTEMKSTVSALSLLTVTVGDLFLGIVYSVVAKLFPNQAQVYFAFAALMGVNFLLMILVGVCFPGGISADGSYEDEQENVGDEEAPDSTKPEGTAAVVPGTVASRKAGRKPMLVRSNTSAVNADYETVTDFR